MRVRFSPLLWVAGALIAAGLALPHLGRWALTLLTGGLL